MDEAAKDVIRAKVLKDHERMQTALAPFYLGKKCPLNSFEECLGMECSLFLLQGDGAGKISSGACCIPLIASQVGPVADGLMQLASQNVSNVPRVIGAGGIKG